MPKKKKKTVSKLQILILFVVGFLTVMMMSLFVELFQMRHSLEFIDSLEESNSQVIEEFSVAKNYLINFGSDLNSIREFLLLPTSAYDFGDLGVVAEVEEEKVDVGAQIFEFVSTLGEYEMNKERYEANLEGFRNYIKGTIWTDNGLTFSSLDGEFNEDSVEFIIWDVDEMLMKIYVGYDGRFEVETVYGDFEFTDGEDLESVKTDLNNWLANDLTGVRELVTKVAENIVFVEETLFADEAFLAVLEDKSLGKSSLLLRDGYYSYEFFNGDSDVVTEIRIFFDGLMSLQMGGVTNEERMEFGSDDPGLIAVVEELSGMDTRTSLEKTVAERIELLNGLMNDRAFTVTLEQFGLTFGAAVDTEERLSYSIYNADEEVLRVMYLDKLTGEIKVEMANGEESQSLALSTEMLEYSGKKKLWICLTRSLSILS